MSIVQFCVFCYNYYIISLGGIAMDAKISNILFCRGGYMKYYRGITNDDIQCVGGGKYNRENIGHECCNFYKYDIGKCYGFVQSKNSKLDIDRIAANTLPYANTNKSYIDNVTVIFVAQGKVVGFYKNARAYRDLQKLENPAVPGIDDYFFECEINDAVLIDEKDRNCFPIKQGEKNWFGEANVFYADSEEILDEVRALIGKVLAYKPNFVVEDGAEDALYQDAVNEEEIKKSNLIKYVKEERKEPVAVEGRMVYPRDAKKAKEVLVSRNFKCEIDGKHIAFKKKNSDELYAEAHHIVPMSKQNDYKYSLDVKANIACLCSNCHRIIHFGSDAPKLIEKLYISHKPLLEASGIKITLDELIDIYK